MRPTGWIIYNGSLKGNSFMDYAVMLQQAAHLQGSDAKIISNDDILAFLCSEQLNLVKSESFSSPDYILFTDKDIYLARQLELLGMKVFNRADAIALSDDKIAAYQRLAQHELPIPDTIIAPKVFNTYDWEKFAYADQVIEKLGFPMIIKEAFGSFGEQVYLVENKQALLEKMQQLHGKSFIFQEFIATSFGKDIRLQVVGEQVVAAMKRSAKSDFRANVTAGAQMERYEPSKVEKQIAIAASKAIGTDFAGVDLLFADSGPVICEVNSNAHIRNLYNCTSINAADYIVSYVLQHIQS
ncbi:RimK family alpha-L-glutamate ligase [Virgibacillus sp. 179-BFC.A HS]|uniref:RimK family alpha-L-glutamate ligase n=1 Tax=Tigheibacillus jepli TaxID=3035914 RepID=A0ABU5CIT9_9BACI|nr:RimK family alpha-L-glutamate ligase [Virgibacillus sp. 179-BFC.A HS]MDY0405443.1 RimK family alpha-L-glutamate ligase [Virgibacillus sp. 179-BFC.A HS]